ncbi:M91 family zinc metallopeptidase [Burkholderia guangdongensis]|uniref:M91 family zinc metallopeptidase n=1 Tax=Burkholderia guangdongensis TaxID=1792500 RepID=UPI0015CE55CB|nr:M91 family zinc metallopeptidase [Burkholderia guangdongensis]
MPYYWQQLSGQFDFIAVRKWRLGNGDKQSSIDVQMDYWNLEVKCSLEYIHAMEVGKKLLDAIAKSDPSSRFPIETGNNVLAAVKVMIEPRYGEGDRIDGADMLPPGTRRWCGDVEPLPNGKDRYDAWMKGMQSISTDEKSAAIRSMRNVNSSEVSSSSSDSAFYADDGKAGGGATAIICWQPSLAAFGPSGGYIPPHVGLAHELIHALHYLTGTAIRTRQEEENLTVGCGKVGNKSFDTTNVGDLPEICENRFRAELKLPLTTEYKL